MATPIDSGAHSSLLNEEPRPTPAVVGWGRGVAVHAWATIVNAVAMVLIWAVSGAGEFWPIWVILATGLALAIHAWVRQLHRRPEIWQRPHVNFALAVEAGIWVSLSVFNVGIWAAAGGGSFWPRLAGDRPRPQR